MNKNNSVEEIIRVHFAARCPLLYLVSWEEERVLDRLKPVAKSFYEKIYVWSVSEGLREINGLPLDDKYQGPYATLDFIGASKQKCLFILLDFHPYINEAKVNRKLRDLIIHLQSTSSGIVVISPKQVLPLELEKDITVIDYPLPSLEDMKALFNRIEQGVKENASLKINLTEDEKDVLLQAALGLTENEAKNVFAKALASNKTLSISDLELILAEKEQIVRKSGILEYFSSPESFSTVGGMDQVKKWLSVRAGALTKKARAFRLPPPKGLLLLGVPGCGKSLIAKTISHEWSQPLLRLDVGKLFEGLVGSSEKNVRQTIFFAEAVAPCILWIDEIEKGFSGIKSLGDSGTSSRVFSTFLTWLQEKTTPVFVVATANDISLLPPELLRKGRFDDIFFVDLPFLNERKDILKIHIEKKGRNCASLGLNLDMLAEQSEGFSGAELEQAIISALYMAFAGNTDLSTDIILASIKETVPLAETMKEPIQTMRDWARKRARYASSMRRDEQGRAVNVERWASIG